MTLTQINKAGLDEIALDHVFTIGASGTDHYTFQGEGLNGTVNDPTLYLTRGKTYRFENGTGAHPIRIQSTSGASGTAYNTGVTNNAGSGTVIVEVQHDAPDVLYYQCTSHANMNGILYITGALADGGVTEAKLATSAVTEAKIANGAVTQSKIGNSAIVAAKVANDAIGDPQLSDHSSDDAFRAVGTNHIKTSAVTTAKIADDAVTNAKIAAGVVNTSELTDNAVTHAKYQDIPTSRLLGRTSSGTGSPETLDASTVRTFLNVADGATASSGTTINNNADNRVITGSGTANTLNGESGLTFNGTNTFGLDAGANGAPTIQLQHSGSGNDVFQITAGIAGVSNGGFGIRDVDESAYRLVINSSGNVGIGTTNPSSALDVNGVVEVNNPSISTDAKLIVKGNDTNNHDIVTLYSNASTRGSFAIRTGTSISPSFLMGTRGSNETLAFMTNNTERLRVTDNGLTFNGDTAAANALDDYEEGTFTPSISSGYSYANTITYTNQAGFYTKIGNQVFAYIYLQPSGNSAHSGNIMEDANRVQIDGLPFTSSNTSRQEGGGYITYTNGFFDTSGTANENLYAVPWVPQNTSYIIFHNRYSGGQIRGNNTNPNGLYLIFQVRYIAA